ncbi:Cnd3 domain-containing protein, partial [Haematococcus lacustris]
DVAVAALLQQLAVEPTQAVRVALIAHLPVNTETLQPLMDRCCDTAPEVRAAVFKRLAALPPGVIRGAARDVVLRAGLRDRVQAVAEAAQQLVAAWLQRGCGGDTERLLQ